MEQPHAVKVLRVNGHQVYDFRRPLEGYDNPNESARGFHWSEIDPQWRDWSNQDYIDSLAHPLSEQGFISDWQAMEWADVGVLFLPCGRSAHLEAGYFVGAGKKLYILLSPEKQEPELMYKMATGVFTNIYDIVNELHPMRIEI